MSLLIRISNDDGNRYCPGSLILGVVELTLHEDQPIGTLSIGFTGRASVLLVQAYGDMTTSRKDYKSVGYLFSQHLNLYQGKWTHRKGKYMWPFAFRVPKAAAPRAVSPASPDFFHQERPWRSDYNPGQHRLPPSFSHGGHFLCFVEYTLDANLLRPNGSRCKNLTAVKAVQIQATTEYSESLQTGDHSYATYEHTALCRLGKSLSMLPKCLRSRSIRTGRAEICMLVSTRKSITLREKSALPLNVAARVEYTHSNNDSQHNSKPTHSDHGNLTIKAFKLSLLQLTQVRAGCHRASTERRIVVRKGLLGKEIPLSSSPQTPHQEKSASSHQEDCTKTPITQVNLADAIKFTIPSTTTICPDFSTYNIANSHVLDITLKMEFACRRFKFHVRHPIKVLASPSDCSGLEHLSDFYLNFLRFRASQTGSACDNDAWVILPRSMEENADSSMVADLLPSYSA